jgi:hypothetical protein
MTTAYEVSDDVLWHESLLSDLLGCLDVRPAAALLVTPALRLFTDNNIGSPRDDSPAFHTEATYTGYAEQAVVLGTPVNLTVDGKGRVVTVTFACTANLVGAITVHGWMLTDGHGGAATRVYAEGRFPAPVTVQYIGDSVVLTVTLPLRSDVSR